ncbi:MAG: SRPBCC family protein [Actinomycetota bacterium]|nr:SRPBCC family protein [Actinomycetota bacterium]
MTTQVSKSILVNVPVSRAYNQWTQFEDFPQFMSGIQSVTQLSDHRLDWVAEIAGVKRQWEAKILEQVPDRKVAWAATQGATNAGSVTFEDLGGDQTSVTLFLEYEPEGLVEKAGDALNIVERQAEGDLERFKTFIESEGYATGAWRGSVEGAGHVGTPGVEAADASRGDSGKAGVSGKAVAAGVGVVAAAAAVIAAAGAKKDATDNPEDTAVEPVRTTEPVNTVEPVVPVEPLHTETPSSGTTGTMSATEVGSGTSLSETRMLTDKEIDEGASDVPLGESEPSRDRRE